MAYLTAQKKETIARTKLSMEEEINEEKLAELLGMNMSEATARLKEKRLPGGLRPAAPTAAGSGD